MLNKKTQSITCKFLACILALSCSYSVAASYQPFPGKHKARLINIDAANTITINFETWPGYARTMSVTLPDLVLPGYSLEPSACELELAQKALSFTQEFLHTSQDLSISNLLMETSSDDFGTANVYTSKGSLSANLKKEGLARSSSIDSEASWCN